MLTLRIGENKTQSWGFGTNTVDGVGRRKALLRLLLPIFENIYSTASPTRVEDVVAAIPTRVTEDMNESLTRVFTREEVVTTLKQFIQPKHLDPTV